MTQRRLLLVLFLTATPVPAAGQNGWEWHTRLHGNGFGMYVDQNTARAAEGFAASSWLMARLEGQRAGAGLGVSAMISLDPITLGECGYPRLVAGGGHTCTDRDHLFEDRSHSHPLIMELLAFGSRDLGPFTAELKAGVAGEPALGPASYLHRASAQFDPLAPMSHHETNPSHIANGLVTAGIRRGAWSLESSRFNARPGDMEPYDLDLGSLSSWSVRAGYRSSGWMLQTSLGKLHGVGAAHTGHGAADGIRIYSASAEKTVMLGSVMLDATAGWARHAGDMPVDAFLLETAAQRGRHTLFARAERVHRVEQTALIEIGPNDEHIHTIINNRRRVSELAGGYTFRLLRKRGLDAAIGARAGFSFIPVYSTLYYGDNRGRSLAVYLNIQPTRAHTH